MKGIILCLLVCLVAFAVGEYLAPLHIAPLGKAVKDHYIVVFQNTKLTVTDRMKHMRDISKNFTDDEEIKHVYDHGTFAGYAGRFKKSTLNRILRSPKVKFVEEDQIVKIDQSCTTETRTDIWHLERIEEPTPVYDNNFYNPNNSGTGIFAYVVDTGILLTHNDFLPSGRAVWGYNAVDSNNVDCNGHGTHVASSIAGTLYGSGKVAELIAVKVLDCAGSGSYAGVIAGINWAGTDSKSKGRKSVMNLSLGGGVSAAVDQAVIAAATDTTGSVDGVFVVVAAGNSNANACNSSPSGASGTKYANGTDNASGTPYVWSVGATDRNDARATFSNWGAQCVNVFAPGVSVTSAWIGSSTAINTISGTSMAAPQVCGIASWYWSQNSGLNIHDVRRNLAAQFNTGRINFANCGTNALCTCSKKKLIYNPKC